MGAFSYADALASPTNAIIKLRGYSAIRTTNGYVFYTNPNEFWNGDWKEGTNGWRVQLAVYMQTNYWVPREGVSYPVSTNIMLYIIWGSPIKNSGAGYYVTPNGKFARFELLNSNGNIIPPNPAAGKNLFLENFKDLDLGGLGTPFSYKTHLPAWASPLSGSLVANFPRTITTNVYPRYADGEIAGATWCVTNQPPHCLGFFKLDEIYNITNEGDYTLIVQPVLYKRYNHKNPAILDRVDLPCVTAKFHLDANKRIESR